MYSAYNRERIAIVQHNVLKLKMWVSFPDPGLLTQIYGDARRPREGVQIPRATASRGRQAAR
jgi:hypothetical protein